MKLRSTLAPMLAIGLSAFAVGCGSDDEPASQPASGGESGGGTQIQKVANAAQAGTITVGSKNFTEQYLLGNIYAQALEAAGYKVKTDLDLGSELIANKALEGGQVSAYPEYTGTALTSFCDVELSKVPPDPDQAYEDAKACYAENKITALPRTQFENTYRLVMTKKKWQEIGSPKNTTELKAKAGELVINGFPECRQRIDCLLGLEKAYDIKFKKFLGNENKYQVLDTGDADVAFGFTTDGNLASGKYQVIEDDKKFFPPYHITFAVRNEVAEKMGPEGQKVITDVQSKMTNEVMQELNARVDVDKQEPEAVAKDYLKQFGFVS